MQEKSLRTQREEARNRVPHGLQGSYMLSLDDETITVHAMSKKSAARITKRSIADMDDAVSYTHLTLPTSITV